MTNLIDKKTQMMILKKNNKFMYKFYILHLKSGKYIFMVALLLMLYLAYRYFAVKSKCNKDTEEVDNMADIKFKKNYQSYSIKNGSKLAENNYLEKYRKMPTRVRPVPNKVINYY
jgi:hypothetical protein